MTIVSSSSSSHSSSTVLLRGVRALVDHMKMERSRFGTSPIILLSSYGDDNNTNNATATKQHQQQKRISDICRYTRFMFQQQLNYRTVVVSYPPQTTKSSLTTTTTSSSIPIVPTVHDVQEIIDLASRVGATTVAAVGSGNVIDLAKAVVTTESSFEEVVLIPATYGGLFVSGTSHSLLYDPNEEAITVHPTTTDNNNQRHQQNTTSTILRTITALDPSSIVSDDVAVVALAVISILLDTIQQPNNTNNSLSVSNLLDVIVTFLHQYHQNATDNSTTEKSSILFRNENQHYDFCTSLVESGNYLSYGIQTIDQTRSAPLAIAVSLLPKLLSQYSIFQIMASTVPTLCQQQRTGSNIWNNQYLATILNDYQSTIPLVVTNESIQTLLSEIRSNQVVWNCYDTSDTELTKFLQNSLLA